MIGRSHLMGILQNRKTVWGIFFLALVVRLTLLFLLHDSYYTSGMAQGELARNIVEGRGFVVNAPFADSLGALMTARQSLVDVEEALRAFTPKDTPDNLHPFIAYMMPGQGILLAASYTITGRHTYFPLQLLQAILDACGVFLLVAIGSMAFTREIGIIAAILFALYIPEARLAITATRDAWMPMVYLTAGFAAVRYWTHTNWRNALMLGGVVALGVYFRSEILLLPFWVGLLAFILGRKLKVIAPHMLVALLPIVFLLLPWTIRNYAVFGKVIPTNSGLWLAMWQSFGEYPNDFGAVNNDVVTLRQMRNAGHTEGFDTPEYDALFKPKVMEVLREQPVWAGWSMVRRVARMPFQMHAWGIAATDDIHDSASPYATGSADLENYFSLVLQDPARLAVHVVTRGVNLLLFLAVGFWFWRNRSGSWKPALILFAVPLYNILVHAVIGVHARYILPTNSIHLLLLSSLLAATLLPKTKNPAL